jgi:uncharacterized protein DUF5985
MINMLWGASAFACVVIALFFLRFFQRSRELLFLLFALGFSLLAINWVGPAVASVQSESRTYLFIVRLAAFLLLLGGIVHKNLKR